MVKRISVVCLIGVLAAAALPLAATAQEDAPPTYAAHGPYTVGTRELVVEDADRPLDVTVWYPALNPDDLPEEVTYSVTTMPVVAELWPVAGHALADAAPDTTDGPYPLVIFSHGLWGFRHCSVYLTEHLASYGFVVMALDHAGNTVADLDRSDAFDFHVYRPWDITRVIDFAVDQAAEGADWAGVIDAEQIAVMGHSFGGYTALAAAGARLDFDEFDALFCKDRAFADRDYGLCPTRASAGRLAEVAGLDETPEGLWPSFGDDRVDAIVGLATAESTLFGHTGLQGVTVPALFMAGTMDMVPPEYYTVGVYEHISSERKALVMLEGAGHTVFVNACRDMPWRPNEQVCSDPAWDMDQAHDLINHFVTAFLLAEFYGDEDAAAALASDTAPFAGITVESHRY